MKEMILNIEGMHCMGCVLGLEEELEKLEFVKTAQASLEEANVKITYNEENFNLDKIKQVVEQLGFEVTN